MWGTCCAEIALVFVVLGLVGLQGNGVTLAHPAASGASLTALHSLLLSYDELEEAAAVHGMELIHPSEWEQEEHLSRRLDFEGMPIWFAVSLVRCWCLLGSDLD